MVTILEINVDEQGMTGIEDLCYLINDGYRGLKLFYRMQLSNMDSFTESCQL